MDPTKRPNSTESKKKMEMINPGKSKISASSTRGKISKPASKPVSKPLQKVSSSSSPSTTLTDFSFNRPIAVSEKQKLELLASDPLSFSMSTPKTDDRSESLKFIQETYEAMIARKEEREAEEAYEEMLDSLEMSQASERFEKMKKINEFVENLKNRRDDDGNLLVELPEDYEEILETAVEYRKIHNKDPDVGWIQVFQAKKEHESIDEEYKKRREKIKALDLVLKEKERALKAIRSSRASNRSSKPDEVPEKDSFFLTKVKTRSVQKPKKVYSEQNFVQKNKEYLEDIKQGSMLDRLTDKEKLRLLEIEENLDKPEEQTELIFPDELKRLEEIDQKLRTYIPQIEWEAKSVSSKSTKKSENPKKTVKPGDPTLREAQERREVFAEMNHINSKLLELQNQPIKPMHEDDVKELLLEHGYDFSAKVHVSLYDPVDRLLAEGKQVLRNISELDKLDLNEISDAVKTSEIALKKFEDLQKSELIDLESDPQFLKLKKNWLGKCEEGQKECENVLKKLDEVEQKVERMKEEVREDEENERKILGYVGAGEVYLQSIEEIDQEISAKVEEKMMEIRPSFKDLEDITPENFPMLYHVYEKVLKEGLENETEEV